MLEEVKAKKTACPYTYDNLVARYYEEATRCLENKCFIAAIAMSWATVDYAIEHELMGGSKFSKKSPVIGLSRYPIEFKAGDIRGKMAELWKIFPALAPWNDKLLRVYDQFRNTYLHAKMRNFKEQPYPGAPNGSAKIIALETPDGEDQPLVVSNVAFDCRDEEERRLTAYRDREMFLIMTAEKIAWQAYKAATDFLTDLNQAVRLIDSDQELKQAT